MKKIVFFICLVFMILLGITLFILLNKKVTDSIKVYSIPKSYCYKYKEDRRISFEIYINDGDSIINLVDQNTYRIVNGKSYFNLSNVNVEIEYNSNYENEDYYKYIISSDILNVGNLNIKNCYLEIINHNFTILINVGSFKIFDNDYKELLYTELYGNYTYLNNELYLTGITITLNGNYSKIYALIIGEGFGSLDYIESDIYKDNEIELYNLNHTIIDSKKNYDGIELNSNYDTYFIPISYNDYYLITNSAILLNIDHENYYVDNYQYIFTNINFDNFEAILLKGEIKYA